MAEKKSSFRAWGYCGLMLILLLLVFLLINVSAANLTYTLKTDPYTIKVNQEGFQTIMMPGFGTLTRPGEPQLPVRTFMIAIPPGAMVRNVQIVPQGPSVLPGSYKIFPTNAVIEGDSYAYSDLQMRMVRAESVRLQNYNLIYGQDDPYPAQIATYGGSGRWRNYTYVQIKYCPIQYRPLSGRLYFSPSCIVSIDYDPSPRNNSFPDHVLDDLIAPWLVNFNEAQKWYQNETPVTLAAKYDYVIIVRNSDMRLAMKKFKAWKEKTGFSVKIVTTDSIFQTFSGRDNGERIWTFLHNNYSSEYWGIRYVLLVGDVDKLPLRLLYPSATENSYASDYYYARLNVDWDVDHDGRWGEFTDDSFTPTPDVLVGRIPFNDTTTVSRICTNVITFEKDTGTWKNKTLMAKGVLDYFANGRTDAAVLAEYLKKNVLDPNGWSYTTLYEKNGLSPSSYSCDRSLSQSNYLSYCQPSQYSVVNLSAHGNPNEMASQVWSVDVNHNGVCDGSGDPPPELTYTRFSGSGDITSNFVSSLVILNGCSTGPLLGDDANFAKSSKRSLYLITATRNSMAKEYLENGAVAVIASSAGSDYGHDWKTPSDGQSQTFDFYVNDYLINQNQKMGDAYYSAHMQYASKIGLQRGVMDFGYLGDPSICVKGYDDHPGGTDVVIYDSLYYDFAADNADGGDMYVAVLVNNPKGSLLNGEIQIYKSTDHGATWSLWHTIHSRVAFRSLDILVSEFGSDEFKDARLLVVTANLGGDIELYRISLSSASESHDTVASEGVENEIWNIQLARDPIPKSFRVYLTYEIYHAKTYPTYNTIKFCRSTSNGLSWQDWQTYSNYSKPSIDAGPYDVVYWAAVEENQTEDVSLLRSVDGGASWGSWVNLSTGDGASSHDDYSTSVAASTDAAIQTAWVAYSYTKSGANGSDIRFAYSTDAGANWTKNQILAGNAGNEKCFNMKAHRAGPSRWMNIAYLYGSAPAVEWQWISGTNPQHWSTPRLINDYPAHEAPAPKIVYSPGAAQTGSAVVYGGALGEKVYFSAPWLSSKFLADNLLPTEKLALLQENRDGYIALNIFLPNRGRVRIQMHDAVGRLVYVDEEELAQGWQQKIWRGQDENNIALPSGKYLCTLQTSAEMVSKEIVWRQGEPVAPLQQDDASAWIETGDLDRTFAVTDLIQAKDRTLYAAAISNIDERKNEGRVFYSRDNGDNWQNTIRMEECWSLSCIFQTSNETLLAGGLMLHGEEPNGVIYRLESGGAAWAPVLIFPNGVVYDIIQTSDHQLYAVTGWGGQIFKSGNDGKEWIEITALGPGTHIYTILQALNGAFFIGGEFPDSRGFIRKSDNTREWLPMDDLSDVTAVYDLMEVPGKMLAAVRGKNSGWVYQLLPDPPVWNKTTEFPDNQVRAVHTLAHSTDWDVYAGVEMALGPSSTRVYKMSLSQNYWQTFGTDIDLANTTFVLFQTERALFAGTGMIYGNIYRYDFETGIKVNGALVNPVPVKCDLSLNYPNPFNPMTRIDYQVAGKSAAASTTIKIYDVLGREVAVLVDEDKEPGYYSLIWDGKNRKGVAVASGIYFCRMRTGDFVKTIRVVAGK